MKDAVINSNNKVSRRPGRRRCRVRHAWRSTPIFAWVATGSAQMVFAF